MTDGIALFVSNLEGGMKVSSVDTGTTYTRGGASIEPVICHVPPRELERRVNDGLVTVTGRIRHCGRCAPARPKVGRCTPVGS